MLLAAGESIVRQASVARLHPDGSRKGTLTLTNQRLVFEAEFPEGPGGTPVVRTTIDAPLGRVRNAQLVGGNGPGARLEVELPKQTAVFELADAPGWFSALSQQRSTAPAFGGKGGGGAAGAPAVVIRCRYCGSLNPPTATKCASCGATV